MNSIPTRRLFRCRVILAAWRVFPVAAAMAGVAVTPAVYAQQTGNGIIEGRVQNAISGNYLTNARVRVSGTNLETFTNAFGEYRLTGMPAGPTTLEVFYTG